MVQYNFNFNYKIKYQKSEKGKIEVLVTVFMKLSLFPDYLKGRFKFLAG